MFVRESGGGETEREMVCTHAFLSSCNFVFTLLIFCLENNLASKEDPTYTQPICTLFSITNNSSRTPSVMLEKLTAFQRFLNFFENNK